MPVKKSRHQLIPHQQTVVRSGTYLLVGLLLSILLSSCGDTPAVPPTTTPIFIVVTATAAAPVPTNSPVVIVVTATSEPQPTAKPTEVPTTIPPSATPLPTNTPQPTSTPRPANTKIPQPTATPNLDAEVTDTDVNVRYGPGYNYPVLRKAEKGEVVTLLGRDKTGKWLNVLTTIPESDVSGPFWILAQYLHVHVNVKSLPAIAAPPVPPTAVPTATIQPGVAVGNEVGIYGGYAGTKQELSSYDAGSSGKFVIISAVVRYVGNSSISVSAYDFTLLSKDNRAASYDVATYAYGARAFPSVRLQYMSEATGLIAFKVPNSFVPDHLVFETYSERVTVDLDNKP